MRFYVLFFIPLRAPYVPWFWVALSYFYGQPVIYDLVGIVIGHTFFFFTEIYPQLPRSKGVFLLKTPKFI